MPCHVVERVFWLQTSIRFAATVWLGRWLYKQHLTILSMVESYSWSFIIIDVVSNPMGRKHGIWRTMSLRIFCKDYNSNWLHHSNGFKRFFTSLFMFIVVHLISTGQGRVTLMCKTSEIIILCLFSAEPYVSQYWLFVDRALGNKFQCNLNQNLEICWFRKMPLKSKVAVIVSRLIWWKGHLLQYEHYHLVNNANHTLTMILKIVNFISSLRIISHS